MQSMLYFPLFLPLITFHARNNFPLVVVIEQPGGALRSHPLQVYSLAFSVSVAATFKKAIWHSVSVFIFPLFRQRFALLSATL